MQVGFAGLDDYPERLSLYTIRLFAIHSKRNTNLFRSINGDRADWGYPEELLAQLIDITQQGNWQRAGNKNAPKPQPMARPWEVKPKTTKHFGDHAVSIEEFHRLWDRKVVS